MGNLATIGSTLGIGASANDTLFGVLDAALTDARVRSSFRIGTYDIGRGNAESDVHRPSHRPTVRAPRPDVRQSRARRDLHGRRLGDGAGALDRFLATLAVADMIG